MAFKKISLWCIHILLPFLVTGEEPLPCVLPFIYNHRSHSSCTRFGNRYRRLWCATTANYNISPQWKYCTTREHGGNSGGEACIFPYTYKNRIFHTCTNEDADKGRFWCATTSSYDRDQKWSYCADSRLRANSQGPCVFPFIYKGKSYSSCTIDGSPHERLWCSLTRNYDADPKWTYCHTAGGGK